jgi:TonB family protein
MPPTLRAVLTAAALSLLTVAPVRAEAPDLDTQPSRKVVILSVVVERDGTISNATVAKSSGSPKLDWVAVDRAHRMKVRPSTLEGVPVRSQKMIAVAVKAAEDTPAQTRHRPITLVNYIEV